MLKRLLRFMAFAVLACGLRSVYAQEHPAEVPGCDVAKNPKAFDGKLIRVRGTVHVRFEDFSLGIENCDTAQSIWLTFGGDVPGIVASTINDNFRKAGADIRVNGAPYGIKKDENFRRFYALIAARRGDEPVYRVTATLTGAFFAGAERKLASGQTYYAGYGHLGCCDLLVITQVSDVESVPPADLNVSGKVVGPDGKPVNGFVVFDDVLGGYPPIRQQSITNEKGEFEFSDSGQSLLFENPRYRPLALTVEPGGAPIRVRLEDAKQSDWVPPSCAQLGDSAGRIGFTVLFALPSTMVSKRLDQTDGGMHSYLIFPRGSSEYDPELVITTTDSEAPADLDVSLDSKWSEYRWIKDSAGTVIGVDSRGRSNHSKYWRTAFFLGHDTVSYSLRSGRQRISLDRVLDSACIASR
jgi:hypothetical protein